MQGARSTALGTGLVLLATVSYGIALNIAVPLQKRYGPLPVLLRAQGVAFVLTLVPALIGLSRSSFTLESVAAMVKSWDPAHIVTVGDNIYPEAETKYFDAAWNQPFGWVDEARIPVLPALGNHDVEDSSSEDVIDFFKDYTFAQAAPAALIPLLKSGQVEAIVTFQPWAAWAQTSRSGS